ncbi:hypothetical protein Trydic_g384 [Trypoxylus dichotomus]
MRRRQLPGLFRTVTANSVARQQSIPKPRTTSIVTSHFATQKPAAMWTESTIEQLISLYKQHPALWDPKDKGYRNRLRKDKELKEIAQIMNLNTVDVERKITVLNTQFRRAHTKAANMRANGLSEQDIENGVWHWYRRLMFLEKRYFARIPIEATILQLMPEQDPKTAIEELESSSDDGISTNGIKIEYSDVTQTNKRPRMEEEIQEKEVSTVNASTSNDTLTQFKDECDVYGELLAIKLRKFDDRTRYTIMHEIDNLIFRTRMDYN